MVCAVWCAVRCGAVRCGAQKQGGVEVANIRREEGEVVKKTNSIQGKTDLRRSLLDRATQNETQSYYKKINSRAMYKMYS